MMSEAGVRNEKNKSFGSTNLIVHQGKANILYQTVESLGILGVVEEIREVVSGYY